MVQERVRDRLAQDVLADVRREARQRPERLDVVRVLHEPDVEHEVGLQGHAVLEPEADELDREAVRALDVSQAREDSLAELARRYFVSHGPATVRDFTWWSGLAGSDAAIALEMVAKELHALKVDEQTYWQASDAIATRARSGCHLLPAYDAYTVAYQDRSAVMSDEIAARADSGHGIFHPPIVSDGQIAGTWSRELEPSAVAITCRLFAPLDRRQTQALATAARRYAKFLGLKPRVLLAPPRGAATR